MLPGAPRQFKGPRVGPRAKAQTVKSKAGRDARQGLARHGPIAAKKVDVPIPGNDANSHLFHHPRQVMIRLACALGDAMKKEQEAKDWTGHGKGKGPWTVFTRADLIRDIPGDPYLYGNYCEDMDSACRGQGNGRLLRSSIIGKPTEAGPCYVVNQPIMRIDHW